MTASDLERTELNKEKTGVKLDGVRGIEITRFTSKDVVRHPLVARIVDAYEEAAKQDELAAKARKEVKE